MEALQQKLTNLEKEITKIGIGTSSHGLPLPEYYSGLEEFDSYLRKFNKLATAHQWSAARCCQILPLRCQILPSPLYLSNESRKLWEPRFEFIFNPHILKTFFNNTMKS